MGKKLFVISFLPVWDFNKGGTAARYEIAHQYAKCGFDVTYFFINYPVNFQEEHPEKKTPEFEYCQDDTDNFKYVQIKVTNSISRSVLNKLIRINGLSSLFWKISIIGKVRCGKRVVKDIVSKYGRPDIIYSVGTDMALATSEFARVHNIFHISRFLGTYLGGIIDDKKKKRITAYVRGYYPEIKGFKKYTDLTVIDDDGTLGDKVYRKLKLNEDNLIFYRDGINIAFNKISDCQRKKIIEAHHLSDKKLVFLLASRIADWKRLDRLISCVSRLPDEYREKIKVIILGDGPMLPEIKKLAAEKDVLNVMDFVGMVSSDTVFDYLQLTDFFISFQDVTNVGNNVLQAVSACVPLMVTDTGNTIDFIGNNKIGYIFTTNGIEDQFSKAVKEVIEKPEIIIKMRHNMNDFKTKTLWSWEERMVKEIKIVKERQNEKHSHNYSN